MGVMFFGIGKGVDIIIYIEGSDEKEVIEGLIEVFKKEGLVE